jgi:DNA-directed RNA polymerase subunit RPC12/RpoP
MKRPGVVDSSASMLLECQNCGAPLDVASKASTVKCNYCGQSARTERYKTVAFNTPPDFSPPREWTPKAESALPQEVLLFRPAVNAARAVIRALAFSGFMTVVIGVFIAWRVTSSVQEATGASIGALGQNAVNGAFAMAGKAAGAATEAALQAAKQGSAGDTVPLLCSGNQTLTLQRKTLVLSSGVPIVATGNCTLRLVGCTVNGATALIVKNNASVTVEGGSLTGKGPAVIVSENGKFEATGGALLTGESTVSASGNGEAVLRGASVVGRRVAISATGNATVNADGAAVEGLVTGKKKR